MGAQNALWMARSFCSPSDAAVIESPGYPGLREILRQTRCHGIRCPWMATGCPRTRCPQAVDVVFVTPSHHCPTNATMPTARRRALLELAAERGFVVVEDDYEFEMSFRNAPSPSLKSIDAGGAVIHVGLVFQVALPGAAARLPRRARAVHPRGARPALHPAAPPAGPMQRTAAHFLSLGHYETQVNRMRAYRRRRAPWHNEDDHRRSLRESSADARHRTCLRHHRVGLHADFRSVSQGRHHLLGLRARRQRRDDGRRLHPRLGQDVDDDRPERPRHHQFRHRR
jgi:DNA-binding transcriptional MocR family regulator